MASQQDTFDAFDDIDGVEFDSQDADSGTQFDTPFISVSCAWKEDCWLGDQYYRSFKIGIMSDGEPWVYIDDGHNMIDDCGVGREVEVPAVGRLVGQECIDYLNYIAENWDGVHMHSDPNYSHNMMTYADYTPSNMELFTQIENMTDDPDDTLFGDDTDSQGHEDACYFQPLVKTYSLPDRKQGYDMESAINKIFILGNYVRAYNYTISHSKH